MDFIFIFILKEEFRLFNKYWYRNKSVKGLIECNAWLGTVCEALWKDSRSLSQSLRVITKGFVIAIRPIALLASRSLMLSVKSILRKLCLACNCYHITVYESARCAVVRV